MSIRKQSVDFSIFIYGDGTSTAYTYDVTKGPFFLDLKSNNTFAGFHIPSYSDRDPVDTVVTSSSMSGDGTKVTFNFNQGFNTIGMDLQVLYNES